MSWKFWQRVPPEAQQEIEALRAKVAEYAEKYTQLETKHKLFIELGLAYFRLLRKKNGDKQIADNMRSFWKEAADGAER